MLKVSERLVRIQHHLVAVLAVWLLVTAPWVAMRMSIPRSPGFFDLAHIGFGLVLVVLGATFLASNLLGGRWRQYFPWAAGRLGEVRTDLAGILRGRIPSSGGAGLFSLIEGLGLLLLLATALTGLGWFLTEGSRAALAWREYHSLAAGAFTVFLVVHAIAAAAHLAEFLRE